MNLLNSIEAFIENPTPLWETELTAQLVKAEWERLNKQSIKEGDYSTAQGYFNDGTIPTSSKIEVYGVHPSDSISIELAQPELLGDFYSDTGLKLLSKSQIDEVRGIEKIKVALQVLGSVAGVMECISQVVKCICLLKQDDPEYDTSHSDPNIPFSIFVSVCEDTSVISNIRVAESILHEAMHLKLTMIEHHIDLIVPASEELYYSPWRGEPRPVRGVLHGLLVFKSIYDFSTVLRSSSKIESLINYLNNRLDDFNQEIKFLNEFYSTSGLTPMGAILTKNLLPSS